MWLHQRFGSSRFHEAINAASIGMSMKIARLMPTANSSIGAEVDRWATSATAAGGSSRVVQTRATAARNGSPA